MKKVFFVALFAMVSAFASAQTSVGVNLLYGTEVENLGLGAKVRYDFSEKFRGEGNFAYYFKKNGLTFWDINANLHYLFPITDKFTVYPLAGLGYAHASTSLKDIVGAYGIPNQGVPNVKSSSGKLGVNLGGGLDYGLTEDLFLNAEVKFQLVNNYNQGVFSVGLVYKF